MHVHKNTKLDFLEFLPTNSHVFIIFGPIIFHELNYKNKKRLFMKTISAIRNVYMGIMI